MIIIFREYSRAPREASYALCVISLFRRNCNPAEGTLVTDKGFFLFLYLSETDIIAGQRLFGAGIATRSHEDPTGGATDRAHSYAVRLARWAAGG